MAGNLEAEVTVADSACQQRHDMDPRLGGGSGENTRSGVKS